MIIASILTAMVLIGDTVRADDVVRHLPKDGAWVRYHTTEKWDDGTERTFQFQISLVGHATVEGEKCRWIELRLKSDSSKSWSVFKWLVPEKQLELGGTALANAHKAWRKTGEKQARETNLKGLFARLYLFVPPPLKGAKKIGKMESVEWQEGQLNCDVVIVRTHDEFPGDTTDTIYRLKLHKRVPFGVAAAKLTVDSAIGIKGSIEYTLLDMGTNAKSEIPEAN
jgi:hypothetical protein